MRALVIFGVGLQAPLHVSPAGFKLRFMCLQRILLRPFVYSSRCASAADAASSLMPIRFAAHLSDISPKARGPQDCYLPLQDPLNPIKTSLQCVHLRSVAQPDEVMTGAVKQIPTPRRVQIEEDYHASASRFPLQSGDNALPGTTMTFSCKHRWKKLSPSFRPSGRPDRSSQM